MSFFFSFQQNKIWVLEFSILKALRVSILKALRVSILMALRVSKD